MCCLAGLLAASGFMFALEAQQPSAAAPAPSAAHRDVINRYCVSCHNDRLKRGGLALDTVAAHDVAPEPGRVGESRPEASRPSDAAGRTAAAGRGHLRGRDRVAGDVARPRGRRRTRIPAGPTRSGGSTAPNTRTPSATSWRWTSTPRSLLPADESSHGFDNVTVGDLSPTLWTATSRRRRRSAGWRSAAPAVRRAATRSGFGRTSRRRSTSRGCRSARAAARWFRYTFPLDGEYEIQIRLARDRNEHVEGLREPHELEVLLDRRARAVVHGETAAARGRIRRLSALHDNVDEHLKVRVPVTAGPHALGVTFLKNPSALLETARQPYQAHFNLHRHPRLPPAIYSISIIGPYAANGPGDTPSRRRIFVCAADEARRRRTRAPNASCPR